MFGYLLDSKMRAELAKTWALAWPVILANLSLPLLSLADAAILGHLPSSVYLAGVTVGGSLMAYVFWGFNFLSMGLSGFTSQFYGARKVEHILLMLKKYTLVAVALILLALLGHRLFIHAGLTVISAGADISEQADLYLSIRMLGLPAIVLNSMLIGFFIGLQNTRISLYSLSLTQVLNIGFNVLFVYGLGYKTAGIAIGTVVSEYLGLLLILWHLRRTLRTLKPPHALTLKLRWQWREFSPIFSVSSHLFVRTFVLLSAFVWFNRSAAVFGPSMIAANGVLLVFFTFISHFLDGTAAAAEAQTGHAYGENSEQRLRRVWQASALLNISFMVVLSGLFFAFGHDFLALLTSQQDTLALAGEHMVWVMVLPLTGGVAFWLDGVFIGARRSKDMRNSVLFAFALFVLSSSIYAQTNHQLWFTFNLFFALRSIWLVTIFYKKMWPRTA